MCYPIATPISQKTIFLLLMILTIVARKEWSLLHAVSTKAASGWTIRRRPDSFHHCLNIARKVPMRGGFSTQKDDLPLPLGLPLPVRVWSKRPEEKPLWNKYWLSVRNPCPFSPVIFSSCRMRFYIPHQYPTLGSMTGWFGNEYFFESSSQQKKNSFCRGRGMTREKTQGRRWVPL